MTKRFATGNLETADLLVDAVYEGGRAGNAGDDPLTLLIGVSNQGGFRYLGTVEEPRLIVLTSSFTDADWPDFVDRETGLVTYFGDNKHPGRELHDTPRFGNILLRNMFDALHSQSPRRNHIPPVLLFGNNGSYRDVVFQGLIVPGFPKLNAMEDLVAIWKISKGQRFQNYRASFTVLNVGCVSRMWLNDIKEGSPLSSNCPGAWRLWVQSGSYSPLQAETAVEYRSKAEQLPADNKSKKIIHVIYQHFKNDPITFEGCAAVIAQLMDPSIFSFELTRPSRDGGRDAIGLYKIGPGASAIFVDFALEAKCYAPENSVGVREVSRLISRLRHRQFGILVTTSYLDSQAYKELKEDQHPVVIVSARDIVGILAHAGLNTVSDVKGWLESNFPTR
jgi:hypothetical protein